ncbi:MAG: class I SAM-dependent methyltransferase [Haloarculaceae archaeon]
MAEESDPGRDGTADPEPHSLPDPFGRGIRDVHRDEQEEPLYQWGDGYGREHPIERFYFSGFDPEGSARDAWLLEGLDLDGPVLDMGAGAGRHTRYLQERTETVAIEPSEHLVWTMRERGVADPRPGDMFELPRQFDRDRFRSAFAVGTQAGIAGSMDGLRAFLADFAHVTDPDGRAVLDCYGPGGEGASDMFGFRADPTPGLAHRVMHFEYEGDVGPALQFRLFAPDRLREACIGTRWTVADVRYDEGGVHYRAALAKRRQFWRGSR